MKNRDKLFGVSKRGDRNEDGANPGPGEYDQSPYNGEMKEWYKKTFNQRYLKNYHLGGGDPQNIAGRAQVGDALRGTLHHGGANYIGHPRAKSHLNSIY